MVYPKIMRIFFIFALLISTQANARVFNITESSFGTYFKGSFGMSQLKDDSYEKSSGAQTVFDEGADFNWAGELGFFFPTKDYSFRLGLQIIAPSIGSNKKGSNSGGTELMTLDSSVTGFFPMAHLEYYVAQNALGRVYLSLGGGFGKVTLKNDYTFTAAGDTAYSPLTSHSQRASQLVYILETSVGYEMPFVQTTTFAIDFGYRYAVANDLEYEGAGSDFNGGHTDGASVVNSDGKKKSLDLGGVFTGLSFRFYFN